MGAPQRHYQAHSQRPQLHLVPPLPPPATMLVVVVVEVGRLLIQELHGIQGIVRHALTKKTSYCMRTVLVASFTGSP